MDGSLVRPAAPIALVVALALGSTLPTPTLAVAPGQFDPGCGGGDGIRLVQPDLAASSIHANALAAGLDGYLWFVGTSLDGSQWDPFVCRVTDIGGGHSCLVIPFDLGTGAVDRGDAVAPTFGGGAVVGCTVGGPDADPEDRAAFFRMTPAFTLDASFGGDGRVDLDLSVPVEVAGVGSLVNGKVVWVGSAHQEILGADDWNFLVGRLNADGTWDTSFDGDGRRVVNFDAGGGFTDRARAIAVQSDGKLVVVGAADTGPSDQSDSQFAVARLNLDGTLDTTFSGDGKLTVDFSGSDGFPDGASAVAIDRFGRIVVAGYAGSNSMGVGVVRLLANGSLDPTFGSSGKTSFSILVGGDPVGEPHLALLPAPGDRIAVMGTFNSGAPGDHQDGYLAVLDVRGQLDPTFDGDGKVTYATFPSVTDVRAGITGAATASGRMIFAGKPFATNPAVGYVGRVYLPGLDGDDFESGDLRVWSIVFGAGGGPSAVDESVD